MRMIDRRSLVAGLGALAAVPLRPARAQSARVLDLRALGAVGDGRADDTAAVARALAAGGEIDGGGRVYAVRGAVSAGPGLRKLSGCTLRQILQDDHLQTLVIRGAAGFRLTDVGVIRGGQDDDVLIQRDMQRNAGIWVQDCSGFDLERVQVRGGGIGTGLVIHQCQGFTVTDAQVSQIHYRLRQRPTDDMLQGIWINRSSSFELVRPRVTDLGGQDDQGFSRDNNRAIAISGSSRHRVRDLQVSNCGQGLDVTGSEGDHDFEVIGGRASDCFSWGFKLANSVQRAGITGAVAERCGLGGFVVSGRSELADPKPQQVEIADCQAIDCGAQGSAHTTFGFGVLKARPDPDYPRRVRFLRCQAIDRRTPPGMKWGFFNEIPAPPDERNRAEQCVSHGAAVAAYRGFGA